MHQHLCFLYSSNQKNEEKRGGSGSNNWGSVKEEARSVYFSHTFLSGRLEMVRSKPAYVTLNVGGGVVICVKSVVLCLQ